MGLFESWAKKAFKKWNGIMVFYMIYDPRQDGKNVFANMIHPDLKQDEELVELLISASDRIRLFYNKHPEYLEELDIARGR